MAKVKRNIMLSGVSGSLCPDDYSRMARGGRTIISRKPNFSNQQFGEAQPNQQRQVKQAPAYGNERF